MADNVLIATKNDVNGAHQQVVQEFLDGTGAPLAVSAANPLPVAATISTVGLATTAGQTTGNASLASIDGKLANPLPISNEVINSLVVTTGRLQVELPAGGGGLTDTQLRATPVPVSFTGGGDATAANQATQITKLTSIDGKVPALGQALAAASAPVVLTAAQLITLTPPAAITGFALATNQQTNAITDAQIRATALPVSGTFFQAIQPVSGTVSTGLSQPLTDTQLRLTPVPVSGTVVTGGLTDTQIRATALPVSGTVTANATLAAETTKVIGTVNVAAAQSIQANAGTNLNTSALALEAGNLATIKTNTDKIPALGQALAAASTPVVLTAAQITTLTPPAAIAGFNLEATQLLVKAKTDNIPAQGQALAAASLPVVLTAAQITTLTPQINALTDTQLRATPVPVSGAVTTGGLTDTQLRATPVPVSGTVAANATLAAETTKVIGTVNVAGTVPVSGSVTTGGLTDTQIRATPLPISGTVSTGLTQPLTDTQLRAAVLPVSVAADADNTATGTLAAAAQTVVLTMGGKSAVGIVITGTWAGTITFEGTVDGTNWNSINAVAASTSTPQPTTTVNGLFRLTPAGLLQARVIMTAFTSGTATVTMRASAGTGGVFANQTVPVTLISNPAEGVVSTVNSSVTTLAANGIFTGTSEDVTNYSSITVALISNVASATDGLSLQQSSDGTNWDLLDVYTIPAATGKTFAAHISAKFYRLVYTNGATLQGSFRLQTIYHKYQQPAATVRPQDGRANDNDFGEELSFLMGYNSIANAWNRIGVTSGNLGGNETVLDRMKVNASLRMIDTAQAVGSQLVGATGTQALGLNVNLRTSSTLAVTTTAATGVAATLTLPAVSGLFHYITSLKMILYSTAARTGTATPIVITTTNIPGTMAFTFDTAGAIGTSVAQEAISVMPLKSSVVNTATTIVAPLVTGGIWRITATYFTGA